MSLAHCSIQVELREVLLNEKPSAMLAASAKGSVPVLVLQDATILDESLDIMRWAINRSYPGVNDPRNWLIVDEPVLADRLININDTALRRHLMAISMSDWVMKNLLRSTVLMLSYF